MNRYAIAGALAALAVVSLPGCGESNPLELADKETAPGECAPDPAPTNLCDVPITMSDGAIMRVNVSLPAAAEGCRFPVILEVTGYNKGVSDYNGCGTVKAGQVARGYATIMGDDRGTGSSDGVWDRYGPRTRQDYGDILDWIQAQPWSNGRVGTTGTSYSAGTAIIFAIEDAKRMKAGKPQAIYGVWGNLMMSDMYRDYPHVGGFANNGFTVPWLGLVVGLSAPPPTTANDDPMAFETWFERNTSRQILFDLTAGALVGEDSAYDNEFYKTHSPGYESELVTAPIAWTGGWFDIFQRGESEWWFRKLPNARLKKMWMQPLTHTGFGGSPDLWDDQGIGTEGEVLDRWWDHTLKGVANDIPSMPNVNLQVMGADTWYRGNDWPAPAYTRFYFTEGESGSAVSLHDGVMASAPGAEPGADEIEWNSAAGMCSRTTIQWSGGFVGGIAGGHPCEFDNRDDEHMALTYTTAPLEQDLTIAGRITADFWIEATRPDAALVVKLTDVAPDGKSTQVVSGHLIARHSAVDWEQSVVGPDGIVIQPFHPFTRAAEQALLPNIPTRMLVELFPAANTFLAGHRLRVAITTSDNPVFSIPAPWLADMTGGQIRLLRGPAYPSHVVLPVVATVAPAAD
jgi:uncharacterized protein